MPKEHDFESQIRNIISDWFSANTYNTGWLLNQIGGVGSPDWTNVHLGDDPSQDSNVNHNLDAPSSDLLIKILVSTDGTDNNSFEPVLSASDWDPVSTRSYGITIFQVDSNNITVQTGNDGILYIKNDGVRYAIDVAAWYYKIKVYKL